MKVIESIGRAARGELVVAPSMAIKLAQLWQDGQKGSLKKDLASTLTEREREVAMRVREGLRTREIATELHRSPLTIKTQLAAIFDKLNVRSRTRVAALLNR